MARLTLKPNPTFKAKVEIMQPGSDAVEVEFVFKHRTRDEMDEFIKSLAELTLEDQVLAVASGWELVDPFNEENVKLMAQSYITAPAAIRDTYIRELIKARAKN
ncbi:hypothetical protein CKY39_19610 [Variovorax boronicumulans]|uniref:Phage protein n=1 Tax=Variovorax boronicumulans TaxID=436515 RepID=A0A250DM13_9BURK|nr:phage tail assembly chaperone [Variovorax boronicumulans]ATA55171.1 hypothetical protein CKY39_19610 [Variovorax boronicumulans]